ncbi:MAG: tetratricopeptide repeat protein [Ignavibacteria bacterium]|nr:tetratricopeptide repeat protein [Ignavibacteria bacterium]
MDKTRLRQVIQTRIAPPKAPKNIIARSGIEELLSSSEGKKLLLVTAPAGYGKTTIVNDYIHHSGKTSAWVHISPDIKNVFDLIVYLISSLNRINAQFGSSILETLSLIENDNEKINDMSAALREIAGLIINELLKHFDREVLIVLDDLQELRDEENVTEFLNMLVRELPDNLMVVIISRQLPKLNLSHFRAKRQLIEISQKELALTKDEITSLASGVYSKIISDQMLDYLESSVGGWITGIHMVLQATENGGEDKNECLRSIPANLFDYFAEEIFGKLDFEVQDFLLKTSHLRNFDSELCGYVLQIDNSAELLDYLLGKNIFLESRQFVSEEGNSITSYDYIQLFRTFLLAKSKEFLPEVTRQDLNYNTSLYYTSKSNLEKALDHSILSGNQKHSEDLILEIFDEYFLNGRFEKLWEWVDSLDESTLNREKEILYFKGILHKFYHGDLDKSIEYTNRAIELSVKEKDEDFTIIAMISHVGNLQNQGKSSEALEELLRLEKKKTTELNKARIFYYFGNVYFQNNEIESSLNYANKALELCRNLENDQISEDVYNLLGNLNIIRGEFVHSIHYYELTLSMTKSLQRKLVVQGNLGILYSRSGKFQAAREYYNETLKLFRYFTSPIFELLVKMTEYTLIFETGDYIPAFSLAEEINKMSLKLKNNQYIYLSYQFMGECSFYIGKNESAGNYFDLAEKYMNTSTESDSILVTLLKTINALNTAPAAETEKKLSRVNKFLSTIDSSYDKTVAGFYTAKFYFNCGNPGTCIEYLEKVFSVSKEKGYFSFLLREFLRSNSIFNISKNKFKEIINDCLILIREITELEWISIGYRDQLLELLDRQYVLKLFAFGGLRFILKGEEIPEKKWIRKNRKLLLCYLMLSHNRTISKDKIIDVFYGDTPVESTDNTFHQAVSNLRTALKPKPEDKVSDDEHDSPELIVYQDKTLRLNNAYDYYSDLEDFDNSILKAGSDQDILLRIDHLIKAANLYAGDVLEGYYEPWCEDLREEYKNKFIKNSEILLGLLAAQNRTEELITYAEKLVNADLINFVSYRELIKAHIKLGKVNLAKNKLDRFISNYEEEMSEKPPKKILNELNGLFVQ